MLLSKQTEGFQDGVGLDDLVLKGDLLDIGIDSLLLAEGLLLGGTDGGEVGNYLEQSLSTALLCGQPSWCSQSFRLRTLL